MDIRTGIGIDFHRLIYKPERPLILGGKKIVSDLAIEGHSDADIILHAISDAVLGALGEADIGTFFSNRDPKNKDLDSRKIFQFTLEKMRNSGFALSNIDISLLGEKPMISPHRQEIITSLVELTKLAKERISVKATTTEKMGALGRSEGIACIANILLFK